jgi:hypothetical protein
MSSYFKTEQYGRDDEVQFLSSWKGLVTKTYEFPQSAGVTVGDKKIIKSGTVYKLTAESATTYLGIVFKDVDVTDGANMGALMVGGRVLKNRLTLAAGDEAGLKALGIFFDTAPAVTRA